MSYTTLYLVRMTNGEILAAYEKEADAEKTAKSWNVTDPSSNDVYYVEAVDVVSHDEADKFDADIDELVWDEKRGGEPADILLNYKDFPCEEGWKRTELCNDEFYSRCLDAYDIFTGHE